jgi:hypothetical protein
MTENPAPITRGRYDAGTALAGLVFVASGVFFLLDRLEVVVLRPGVVLPAVVVGLGCALIVSSLQRHRGE